LDGGTINYLASSVACPNASIVFNDITPVTGGLSDPAIGGSVTYQWEVNYNGGGFEDIVGATGEFYTASDTAFGTYVYRRKVTDACTNTTHTNSITIIREELAPLTAGVITYTEPTTVCFGDTIVFNNVTAASGGLTASEDGGSISYQWEVSM